MPATKPSNAGRRRWAEWELQLLRTHFADSRTIDIALALGRAYSGVARKALLLGLSKSAAFQASELSGRLGTRPVQPGIANRFQPGQAAWNKGAHYQPGGRCAQTQFKPGRAAEDAYNYRPIGSLRVSRDGYLERKTTDDPARHPVRRWEPVHRLVWEAAHGPVPAGHVVVFKPGRRSTELDAITLDALELLTRQQLMARNSFHRYGPEVAQVVQLRAALSRRINRMAEQASAEVAHHE